MNQQEKTETIYQQLREEYTENECMLFFGGREGLRQIMKDGQLNDLYSWLNQPAEDWQKDC